MSFSNAYNVYFWNQDSFKTNIEFKPFLRDLRCFSITFFHVCHQTFQKTEMCHTSTLRTFAFHPKVVSNPFSKIFSLKIIPTPTIISHRKDSPSHYQLENNDSLETCCKGIEINICKRLMTPVNSFQWNLNIALWTWIWKIFHNIPITFYGRFLKYLQL